MKEIHHFFSKTLDRIYKRKALEYSCIEIIKKETNVIVSIDHISIQGNDLCIKTDPLRKNTILMHKKTILEKISLLYPSSNIQTLR